MKLITITAVALCLVGASVAQAQDVTTSPKRTYYVAPLYPEAAKQSRVTGTVVAEVMIDGQGNVADAKILRSVAGLDQAALDAVRQWRYAPTTLNGRPVPVMATVSVNFSLADQSAPALAQDPAQWPLLIDGKMPLRIGGNIPPPERTKYVTPAYPQDAKDAGVSGIVIMEIVVDGDGKVAGSHLLRSVPLLDQAAVDAVMAWEYAPVLLNGNPVPVLMTVTVNFTLK